MLFGLAPALSGSRVNLVDSLKQGGRSGTAGKSGKRLRNILVVTEMALSLMLLVGASLLVQSIQRLEHQNLGIREDHLLKGSFYLPPVRYPDPNSITRFCDNFAARIRALPGVIDASVTTTYPPTNGWIQMLTVAQNSATRIQDIPTAQFGVADKNFRETLGIPLLRGRDFASSDTATSPPVALISRELQRRYFPTRDPIGEKIHIGPPQFLNVPPGQNTTDASDVTIIGIVGDFKNAGLTVPPEPQITVLYSQHPLVNYGFKNVVIRTASTPRALAPEIQSQMNQIDPDLPLAEVQTIEESVERQTGGQRFTAMLLASFAAAGLALAIVGIYGVISYVVTQRTPELAVRMALGASRANLYWQVVKQGVMMAATGAAIGLAGAAATQKLISKILYGISPADPTTYATAALFLLTVATIASAIPATRATQITLIQFLRQE